MDRQAENIIRTYETELYLYSRILGIWLADEVEPVEIFSLPAAGRQSGAPAVRGDER
jgi:hypothetical protein